MCLPSVATRNICEVGREEHGQNEVNYEGKEFRRSTGDPYARLYMCMCENHTQYTPARARARVNKYLIRILHFP